MGSYSDSNAMHFYNILTVGQFSWKLSHLIAAFSFVSIPLKSNSVLLGDTGMDNSQLAGFANTFRVRGSTINSLHLLQVLAAEVPCTCKLCMYVCRHDDLSPAFRVF